MANKIKKEEKNDNFIKIKFNKSVAGSQYSYGTGDIVELNHTMAAEIIEKGFGEKI